MENIQQIVNALIDEKAKENKNAESNTTSDKKELKLPKLKIKGF